MCDRHTFAFDVDKAYADQLVAVLEDSPEHPLVASEAPARIGGYALYVRTEEAPVYVGKVDSSAGLRRRLAEHAGKTGGRENIDLADVLCRFLCIQERWQVARAEDVLIKHYDPAWNKIRGFGMHVPGSGRPGMPGYLNEWDQLYPLKPTT